MALKYSAMHLKMTEQSKITTKINGKTLKYQPRNLYGLNSANCFSMSFSLPH